MYHGFVRTAVAIPTLRVADCTYNVQEINRLFQEALQQEAEIVAFPELSLTGYSCGDLFGQQLLLEEALSALQWLVAENKHCATIGVIGMPLVVQNRLYNTAVLFAKGTILGIVPKSFLPNYNEFYEQRWFASGAQKSPQEVLIGAQRVPFGTDLLFQNQTLCLGVEICEDLWAPIPPSSYQALAGADLLINLSASNEMIGKHTYLKSLLTQQSARTIAGYLYVSAGFGESSTDLVFAGNGFIIENGVLLKSAKRFSFESQCIVSEIDIERLRLQRQKTNTFYQCSELSQKEFRQIEIPAFTEKPITLSRTLSPTPFIPAGKELDARCEEIVNIQLNGLARRVLHTHAERVVVGISGGLDSTLALLICVQTFDKLKRDRKEIIGITMPGFGTTDRTYRNALALMRELGITIREISIAAACEQHFADIGFDPALRGATYENTQARERTQILMDVANQTGGIVVGTGDLSELALGWATYNGDHMSMYGVNGGIPKTLVRHLVAWIADLPAYKNAQYFLKDIINTPISPELLPAEKDGSIAQKTEELVGPYELHDFFLYYTIRFGFTPQKIRYLANLAFQGKFEPAIIRHWQEIFYQRFFSQQFKRSALPDGPKVGSVTLSPRGDWRMPSDAHATAWCTATATKPQPEK